MRKMDLLCFVGWGLFVAGVLVSFSTSLEQAGWFHWVVGGTMWAVGFGCIVGWLLMRWMPQEGVHNVQHKRLGRSQ